MTCDKEMRRESQGRIGRDGGESRGRMIDIERKEGRYERWWR